MRPRAGNVSRSTHTVAQRRRCTCQLPATTRTPRAKPANAALPTRPPDCVAPWETIATRVPASAPANPTRTAAVPSRGKTRSFLRRGAGSRWRQSGSENETKPWTVL